MCSSSPHLLRLGLHHLLRSSPVPPTRSPISSASIQSSLSIRSNKFDFLRRRCSGFSSHYVLPIGVMDEDSVDVPSLYDEGDDGFLEDSYNLSSSEGEESDFDLVVNPNADIDLPTRRGHLEAPDPALTVTVHRLATIQGGHRRSRCSRGVWGNTNAVFQSKYLLILWNNKNSLIFAACFIVKTYC